MKRSAWRYLWTSVDIRKKLLVTLALLILYRFAANIPVPGINRAVIASIFQQQNAASSLLGVFDLSIRWNTVQFFNSCDGCVSLYYCTDYHSIIGSDHSLT